jgi:hypothetical protein
VLIENPTVVCGGVIGGQGRKFCLVKGCTVSSHVKNKAILSPGNVYIQCKNHKHARVSPTVPFNFFPEDELERLLEEYKSYDVLKLYMDGLLEYESNSGAKELGLISQELQDEVDDKPKDDVKLDVDDVKPDIEILDAAHQYVTPKKIRLDPTVMASSKKDSNRNVGLNLQTLTQVGDPMELGTLSDKSPTAKALRLMLGDWEAIQSNFILLSLELDKLTDKHAIYKVALGSYLKTLTDHIASVGHKATLLSTKIGSDDDKNDMSIWETISELQQDMQGFWSIIKEVSSKAAASAVQLTSFHTTLTEISSKVNTPVRLRPVIEELNKVAGSLHSFEQRFHGYEDLEKHTRAFMDHYNKNIPELQKRIIDLDKHRKVHWADPYTYALGSDSVTGDINQLRSDLMALRLMIQNQKEA